MSYNDHGNGSGTGNQREKYRTARPNILFMHGDGAGRFIQPCGYAVPTPNLQRLAERGTMFRHAFSAAPNCSPSRAALLCGNAPHSNGMNGLLPHGHSFLDPDHTLPHVLRGAGYLTVMAAPTCFVQLEYERDVMPVKQPGSLASRTVAHADAACGFLDEYQDDRPFFLNVGFGPPKGRGETGPLTEESSTDSRYIKPPERWPDTPAVREDWARHMDATRLMDAQMGRVLDALDRNGLADNTIVICTTDHGPAGPGMKSCLTEEGLGVFLLMRGPGGFNGGNTFDALVSQIDIAPTLYDFIGLPRPAWVEGVSLLPLVNRTQQTVRDEVYGEITYHWTYKPARCVRTDRYRYVRSYYHDPNCDLANVMNCPAKETLVSSGAYQNPPPPEALYDLDTDSNETRNLVDAPEAASVAADLRARLDRWMARTEDPLLFGPVPLPDSGHTNSPDDVWRQDSPFQLSSQDWNQKLNGST